MVGRESLETSSVAAWKCECQGISGEVDWGWVGGGGVADDGVQGDHAEGCFEDGEMRGVVVEGADDVGYEGEFVVEDVVVEGGEFRGRAGG